MIERAPTSLLSAAGLIAGFGTAVATGSRPLGGAVLALFGLTCIYFWVRRDGTATAVRLTLRRPDRVRPLPHPRPRDRRLALGATGLGADRLGMLALVGFQVAFQFSYWPAGQ